MKILNSKFQILNSNSKALQSLSSVFSVVRSFCDPAWEGDPYTNDKNVEISFKSVSNWTSRVGFRQRLMLQKI